MTDTELARLQLLRQSISRVLEKTVEAGKKEVDNLSPMNYNTKKTKLTAMVDLYIDHLKTVRKTVVTLQNNDLILRSAQLIAADIRRWEVLRLKIAALKKEDIPMFKEEMTHLLRDIETELLEIQKVITEEIRTRVRKAG